MEKQLSVLQLKLGLIAAIRGVRLLIVGECACLYNLDPVEVMAGFKKYPADKGVYCPHCARDVQPALSSETVPYPFIGPTLVLDRLMELKSLPFEELEKDHRAIFYSALVHFGTLYDAFKQRGIIRQYDPRPANWQDRIAGYLGRLPDETIAQLVGEDPRAIAKLRRQRQKPTFSILDVQASI